jgi:hypothetical protein
MRNKPKSKHDPIYALAAKIATEVMDLRYGRGDLPLNTAQEVTELIHIRLTDEARMFGKRLESIVISLLAEETKKRGL